MMDTMKFSENILQLLDQTILPHEICYVSCRTLNEVAEAIKTMKVRGAPAIGAAAAFGLVIAANNYCLQPENFDSYINDAAIILKKTRPTAVNLFWAIDRMLCAYQEVKHDSLQIICDRLNVEAKAIFDEDIASNKRRLFSCG